MSDSWAECYARYEQLKGRENWSALAIAMVRLIDRIRADPTFPETIQFVSHAWLRIGPPSPEPKYRPTVWVGWRKPNYYWIGVGSFGTKNRIIVSAEKAVPMLKRYLSNLNRIDPAYPKYIETPPADHWSKEELEKRYSAVETEQMMPTVAEDITVQTRDIRNYVEQLHEAVSGLDQINGANQAIEEILKRLDRIGDILELGQNQGKPEPPRRAPDDDLILHMTDNSDEDPLVYHQNGTHQNGVVPKAVAVKLIDAANPMNGESAE